MLVFFASGEYEYTANYDPLFNSILYQNDNTLYVFNSENLETTNIIFRNVSVIACPRFLPIHADGTHLTFSDAPDNYWIAGRAARPGEAQALKKE